MQKTILALATLFSVSGLFAQNAYNHSVSQQSYTDLTGATSFNNNQVWDFDSFGPITMPFDFAIDGSEITQFSFFDDNFELLTADFNEEEGTGYFDFFAATTYIQDRTYNSGVSGSPLSYKVEGSAGNRILKLEAKNVGLEEDPEGDGFYYMNYQIWLYESDNSVEIHYGPSNITSISVLNGDDLFFAGIGGDMMAYFLYGESTNPTYGEFTEETFPAGGVTMDMFPANGTVYKLTPASVAGVNDHEAIAITLYPNPTKGLLNLKSNNLMSPYYAIYDITGKLIMEGNMGSTGQINVEALTPGMYHIKIDSDYLKFIKE